MVTIHNLGFPRIGEKRELKFALESYWAGQSSEQELQTTAKSLRQRHWQVQSQLDLIPVGDFSFYDQVLDCSFLLGNVPNRFQQSEDRFLDTYFRAARGRSGKADSQETHAGEMTKWFDTNYHYIVPELSRDTDFSLNAERLLAQVEEAQATGQQVKPVIIGPLTYLWLSKVQDDSEKLGYLEKLIPVYQALLAELKRKNVIWVQIDEPILVTELDQAWRQGFEQTYHQLNGAGPNILLATYFGQLQENLQMACQLPVQGLHVNAVNASEEIEKLVDWLPIHKVLSLGVVDGRNIWKTNLTKVIAWLLPIADKLEGRLWLAPNCSLLHVPYSLRHEDTLATDVKNWLSYAEEKLEELSLIASALNDGAESVAEALANNAADIASRKVSSKVHNLQVKTALSAISERDGNRKSSYATRSELQQAKFQLPLYPTTTIGSFPQTQRIRQARKAKKANEISLPEYQALIKNEIRECVAQQHELELDVLVHGEAERNDMVEYFGEQLEGFAFSTNGWVQSYGSRCVKPPILFGDVSRPDPMTVEWIKYAQSLTDKPMKGMLTGPVTVLNWSFVRDDQALEVTCKQLALAIREEVLDLEAAGIDIIQIDEAALREGLPLRRSQWKHYLDWAVESFRICANGVEDTTQIHTHMCYSEFNDIIESIAEMDADVITIETSRSNMELLDVFDEFEYPNAIGPGVYDIHSPNQPPVEQVFKLMLAANKRIPAQRLWVNPDCGLKTRHWDEVIPALSNMVTAAKQLREKAS